MLNTKAIIATFGLLLAAHTVCAQDREKLVGIWKLVSYDVEFQATGERKPMYGKNPTGYLIFASEGRMMGLITAGGRKPGETDQDRAALSRTMIAYTGTYHVEADKFTTKVDASWNESWTGTNQVRFYKLDGNRLDIIAAWAPSGNLEGRPIVRGILTWERAK
jgi:Lipocalin-like domain